MSLHDRIGAALDHLLDIEREVDDELDDIADDWMQIARTGLLCLRDRLEQLERADRIGALELELDRDLGEEAPA